MRKATLTQKDKKRNDGISDQMKRQAKKNQCPECQRKNALKTTTDGDFFAKLCRFCGYERGGFFRSTDLSSQG